MSNYGYVSIRNEDGTSYLGVYDMWGPYSFRVAVTEDKFKELQAKAPNTTRNNCPDNGYFGLMNLKFIPCSKEDGELQTAKAMEEYNKYDEIDY